MSTPSDHLLRAHAPIATEAWKAIDDEATQRLTPLLAGRRLADWEGPGGWPHSATSLGRTGPLDGPPPGISGEEVRVRQRRVLPLAEIRVPFTVARAELEDVQRGALDLDFDDLGRAARVAAEIENRAVVHGWPAAGIAGITETSPYPAATLGTDCQQYPSIIARAVDTLRCNGIEGPYGLAIGPAGYTRIVETTEHGGYPLFDHLTRILGGTIVWAPGVDGAVVVSRRGGDFLLDVGQDLSVGYSHHDADAIGLYLEESFTFRVVEPDAAVALH
ncbi:family 1 encapsulin nanocompartment shell protein [Pseudonocardia asaccharolytica]|uniref:Type 1 encapsulin shell protein n=1 Tax=Pseudonocardia asaccharolytica DSM 44247 = NBRC 16224 TaxID=1123024 RepID=A0A511D8P8_9PSEU|nr:family 1 encapsulin nanocompartment shell protein [Pseudonocardia asaccharolytica]GEL20034.1 bacteriocin [Pseudonocardia asaccharolytica DSM 44247 = NBRC 16224]